MPTLPCPNRADSPEYWAKLRTWARGASDGCTGVLDIHIWACWEHDFHYRHGRTLYAGEAISRREADARFREVNAAESRLGRFSPLAWWRWAGVRVFGAGKFKSQH